MSGTADVLVVGSGGMAVEYLKVLTALGKSVVVVGRSEAKVNSLKDLYPAHQYHAGGLENYLQSKPKIPEFVINAVNVESLGDTSCKLIASGAKYLLLEKPGDVSEKGLIELSEFAKEMNATVCVAYNRRFFTSVIDVIEESKKDGGILSAHFEFTEWTNTFGRETHSELALNKWVFSNSSHVIDTVFYLIGNPRKLTSEVLNDKKIDWHPAGSIFVGSGISVNNIPFSYHANWVGPGRWGIELITSKRRFYLKPMEKLFEQHINTIVLQEVSINDKLDKLYKPGLYLQVESFLNLELDKFLKINEQVKSMEYYKIIAGY